MAITRNRVSSVVHTAMWMSLLQQYYNNVTYPTWIRYRFLACSIIIVEVLYIHGELKLAFKPVAHSQTTALLFFPRGIRITSVLQDEGQNRRTSATRRARESPKSLNSGPSYVLPLTRTPYHHSNPNFVRGLIEFFLHYCTTYMNHDVCIAADKAYYYIYSRTRVLKQYVQSFDDATESVSFYIMCTLYYCIYVKYIIYMYIH